MERLRVSAGRRAPILPPDTTGSLVERERERESGDPSKREAGCSEGGGRGGQVAAAERAERFEAIGGDVKFA